MKTMKPRFKTTFHTLVRALLLSLCFPAFGQAENAASKNVWQDVKESSVVLSGGRGIVSQTYRTVHLDNAGVNQLLAPTPLEFTGAARKKPARINLPMPEGPPARAP